MTENTNYLGSDLRYRTFVVVKYLVYGLLSLNVFFFLQEEMLALGHRFTGGLMLSQITQAFASTIDTAAWLLLLLLFELETAVLDDRFIRGPVKWALHGIRALCFIAVVYAFTGYFAELLWVYNVMPLAPNGFCALLGENYSLLVDIDEYVALDASNCALAVEAKSFIFTGSSIVAQESVLQSVRYLAWTDLVNSAVWILVVVILEVEVRLQLNGNLTRQIMNSTGCLKLALYITLFIAAGYWGYAGDFIDVWDASLWLFAFIFIEMNVFEWQYETTQAQRSNRN